MVLPIIENGFRAILGFTPSGGGREWSTHLDYVSDHVSPAASEVAEGIEAAMEAWKADGIDSGNETRDLFTASQDFIRITIYPLDGESVPYVVTPAVTSFGTNGEVNSIPPDLAVVTTLRTAERGPRGRGRMFWQAGSGTVNNSGMVSAAAVRQFGARVGVFFGTITDTSLETFHQVVIGRESEGSSVRIARPVIQWSCDTHFDVQRRRGLG